MSRFIRQCLCCGCRARYADWAIDEAGDDCGGQAGSTRQDHGRRIRQPFPANHAVVFRALKFAMKATTTIYEQFLRDLKEAATKARWAAGSESPQVQFTAQQWKYTVPTGVDVTKTGAYGSIDGG